MLLKRLWRLRTRLAIALATILLIVNSAAAQNFPQMYVFGDSLSDMGNVFNATARENPPSPPYFQGRYSNGSVWVEYLASELGATLNLDTNFAYGGATTGTSQGILPGLLTQIDRFKSSHSSASPNALYVIWAGANDYLNGTTNSTPVINNLEKAIQSLTQAGARNIVVVNLPDLGKLPGTRTTQFAGFLNNVTQEHNSKLAALVKNLPQQGGNDINITYLDINSIFNQAMDTPEKFGFTNVTEACFTQTRTCARPSEYLFWDNIHPTTTTHKLLAKLTLPKLKPEIKEISLGVPEIFIPVGIVALGGLLIVLVFKLALKRQ